MLRESYENGLVVHEFAPLLLVYLQYITIYKYCLIVWLLSEKRKESMCCFLVLFPIRYSSTALVSCLQLRKSLTDFSHRWKSLSSWLSWTERERGREGGGDG